MYSSILAAFYDSFYSVSYFIDSLVEEAMVVEVCCFDFRTGISSSIINPIGGIYLFTNYRSDVETTVLHVFLNLSKFKLTIF